MFRRKPPRTERTVKEEKKITIFVDRDLCKGVDGCGLCMHVCPGDVYEKSDSLTDRGICPPYPSHPDRCTGCMLCMMYCPDFAIVVETEE